MGPLEGGIFMNVIKVVELTRSNGQHLYITQEKEVHSFDSMSGSLKNYENWFMKPMEFEGLLSYSSYHGTGLYRMIQSYRKIVQVLCEKTVHL